MVSQINSEFNPNIIHIPRDPEKEEMIRNAFLRRLAIPLKTTPAATTKRLIQWIEFYSPCLGGEIEAWNAFAALKDSHLEIDEIRPAIDGFFAQIREQMRHDYRSNEAGHASTPRSVVVLTTLSCDRKGVKDPIIARGHYSPALAIASSLKAKGFHVTLMDNEDGEPCDPDRFPQVDSATRYRRVREKIACIRPSMIISSICHDNENLGFRFDLNIPFIGIQTDYAITRHIARTEAPLDAKEFPQFFEMARYAEGVRQLILWDSDKTGEKIRQAIGDVAFSRIIQPYIFPTRAPFIRNQEVSSLTQLRQEMGMAPDEQMLIFTAGSIEGYDLAGIIPILNETKTQFRAPLYVMIVCGSNVKAKAALEEYLKKTPWHRQIRFQLEGVIDAEKMARFGQVASLANAPYHGCMIGKAGGSTVSENLVTGLYLLMLPDGGCQEEAANRLFLQQQKLGEEARSFHSIVPQLQDILNRKHPPLQQIGNWESRFMEILDGLL